MACIQELEEHSGEWRILYEDFDELAVLLMFRALDARKAPLLSLRYIDNSGKQRRSMGGPRVPVGYEIAATSTGC